MAVQLFVNISQRYQTDYSITQKQNSRLDKRPAKYSWYNHPCKNSATPHHLSMLLNIFVITTSLCITATTVTSHMYTTVQMDLFYLSCNLYTLDLYTSISFDTLDSFNRLCNTKLCSCCLLCISNCTSNWPEEEILVQVSLKEQMLRHRMMWVGHLSFTTESREKRKTTFKMGRQKGVRKTEVDEKWRELAGSGDQWKGSVAV